jgi:nicotinamidase-related amidase
MPVTTLDPKTALIVVDLQKGIMSYSTTPTVVEVVEKAAALTAAFRRHELPVVLVNALGRAPGRTEQVPRLAPQLPPDFGQWVPELNQQPDDHLVTKRTWSAFTHTDLDAHLKKRGVTQVVVCGVATSIGVESTARCAHENGFHVTLAIDAMSDMSPEAHTNSLTRIFPRLGETGTTQEIIALLENSRE